MCPRRGSNFSCLAKKRRQKKGRPPSLRPLRARGGANLRRCACGVRRARTHYAAAQLRSNNHGESVYASMRAPTRMPPRKHPATGAATRGLKTTRAIAALGLTLRGAKRLRPSGPSAAMTRLDVGCPGSLLSVPRSAAQGVGMRAEGHACFVLWLAVVVRTERRRRAVSSTAHPLREHRRLPPRCAWGSRTAGSPFLCLLSFGEAKESESPRRGDIPASTLSKAAPPTIKKIAGNATPLG